MCWRAGQFPFAAESLAASLREPTHDLYLERMNHEQKFWQGVASAINPGWTVCVDPLAATETATLSGNHSFIYVVDVANGWIGAGATNTTDAAKILDASRSILTAQDTILTHGSLSLGDVAGKAICLCGAAHAQAGAPEVAAAISMTVAAFQETQTHARAVNANRQTGQADLAGHWIYIAYRTKNAKTIITRPVWLSALHPGLCQPGRFLDPEKLTQLVRTVVQGDTSSASQTVVGSAIAADGGAILSPTLMSST
jgi:hypothetical protein